MNFLRRQLPVVIAFCIGIFMFALYYIPSAPAKAADETLNIWILIISAFAMLLGIDSILGHHIRQVRKRAAGYGYSWALILAFVAMTLAWIPWWRQAQVTGAYYPWGGLENPSGVFSWLFYNMMVPMQATMFAILAFYIASAAYRSFRARTPEATVLLIAAAIVMLGRVPLGSSIGDYVHFGSTWVARHIGLTEAAAFVATTGFMSNFRLETITSWLLNIPNAAGFRGIVLGVGLGIIATSVRIIFGVEKTYMGGGD